MFNRRGAGSAPSIVFPLLKNDSSTQVLYLNQRILSYLFQNEHCWVNWCTITTDFKMEMGTCG
ncbi:hypothetical protein FJR38_03600 [Anabaena sp. UHCC 0253]|nr:hypothetical protein [Anabaena sp. UHCC 0204]MTJ51829.1 hypothetical protein [Anabaena sp. UHCC 0253]